LDDFVTLLMSKHLKFIGLINHELFFIHSELEKSSTSILHGTNFFSIIFLIEHLPILLEKSKTLIKIIKKII
jgi:hypothetical protein